MPRRSLVPGDIVRAGRRRPGARRRPLLEARDFFVNEALLTGESFPVEKRAGPMAIADAASRRRANAVFMGTLGRSAARPGCWSAPPARATALGEISATLRHAAAARPPSSRASTQFGMLIMRLTVLLVLFVLLVNTAVPPAAAGVACCSRWRWRSG